MNALIAAAVLAAAPAGAKESHVDPQVEATSAYIQVLNKRVEKRQARKLGRLIVYWAQYYDIEPLLLTAILRQESNFESGVKACWQVVRKKVQVATCDYGIAQVNEVWVTTWKLDQQLLQFDDSYNIRTAARILARVKKDHGDEVDWYGRYNSALPRAKAAYLQHLQQFLALQ